MAAGSMINVIIDTVFGFVFDRSYGHQRLGLALVLVMEASRKKTTPESCEGLI
jgi:hypothetical protein